MLRRSLHLNIDRYSQESSSYILFENKTKTKIKIKQKTKKSTPKGKKAKTHTHKFTSKYRICDTALVCVYVYIEIYI